MLGLLPMLWNGFRERYAARLGPDVHEAGDALFANLEGYLNGATEPWTIVHGDYRLDNLLFGGAAAAAPVAVVDWQTCAHGPALNDVAYFIGAGLTADDRRRQRGGPRAALSRRAAWPPVSTTTRGNAAGPTTDAAPSQA